MTVINQRLPLNRKEAEALAWGLAGIGDFIDRRIESPTDPLAILINLGYSRDQIGEAVEGLWEVAYGDWLAGGWTDLEKAILRCCIENTDWIGVYRTSEPTKSSPGHIEEALAALRSLAAKFEHFGIEVNHLPFD